VSEIDDGLIGGETVVLRTNKHWLAPIADSKWAILMLVGVVILAWLEPERPDGILSFIWRLVDLIQLGLFLGAIGWMVYNIVAWRTAEYGVTTLRVRGHEGLAKKRATDSLLTSVTDVQSKSSVIGRSLGFGNIRIVTASGNAGEDTFTSMKGVDEFKKAILEQKVAASAQPAPAQVRPAAAPVAAAGPAPAPVAAPAPAPDAIGTINELAKLRDSGAISPEEFEAKKAELLSRI
jgi:Bacterial PH domain/Short C-terminal domain